MATSDRQTLFDGSLSFEGGVDGGRAPVMLGDNQVAYAINATFRGGYPKQRPKVRRLSYTVSGAITTAWASARFQGAGGYRDLGGAGHVVASIGGKSYRLPLDEKTPAIVDMVGSDTSVANNPNNERVWFCQAENYLIDQDGRGRARIWDGNRYYRSAVDQIPIGTRMAYGIGRLWVANGSSYYGGDLVESDPSLGKESVLHFTENTFLSEGGAFSVPISSGGITALAFTSKQDTVSGEGSLMVFTRVGVFEFDAPIDRTVWADLQQPIQRFSLINFGATSQEATINVNGDLFFRAEDGIRSFYFARRDFGTWGNTPISREVGQIIDGDASGLLKHASAVNFSNRAIFTANPKVGARGVSHERLVALDFDLISGMRGKLPPAWEGEWSFDFDIYQILTVDTALGRRCIVVASDDTDTFAFYELLQDSVTGDEVVSWGVDTKGYTFQLPMRKKQVQTFESWLSGVSDAVNMDVWFKRNDAGCWSPWARYAASAPSCAAPACSVPSLTQNTTRSRVGLPLAPANVDSSECDYTRDGYDFQFRVRFNGDATLRRFRVTSVALDERESPTFTNNCTTLTATCETCQ